MGFREGMVRDEILLMIGMFFGNVEGGKVSRRKEVRSTFLRSLYKCGKNVGKREISFEIIIIL